jgi:hypothetical protein
MADLEARGVRLTAVGERLRVDAPCGVLAATDRDALVQHKPAILAALRVEPSRATVAIVDDWADGVPAGSCGLCGHKLREVRDWPTAGESRRLCLACAGRPALALETVYASLTPAERQRLVDEARVADGLGQLLLKLVPSAGMA